jgi:hypothetical protein
MAMGVEGFTGDDFILSEAMSDVEVMLLFLFFCQWGG